MPAGQGKDTEDKYWRKVSTYLLKGKILAGFQIKHKCLKSSFIKLKDYFPLSGKKKMKHLKNLNIFHESFMKNSRL